MVGIRRPAIVLGLTGAVLAAAPLAARPLVCAPKPAILERLAARFGEIPFAEATSVLGHYLVVTLSAKGTWTALAVRPGGLACILDAGSARKPQEEARSPAVTLKGFLSGLEPNQGDGRPLGLGRTHGHHDRHHQRSPGPD